MTTPLGEDETPTSEGFTPFDAIEEVDTDPSIEEIALFGRSTSGLPLDAAGQEWDLVTPDGHGFNDSDGPEQMASKADWGPLVDRDVNHFFECHVALESAKKQGEGVFELALTSFRIRNANQWERVRLTFFRHFGASDERFSALFPPKS